VPELSEQDFERLMESAVQAVDIGDHENALIYLKQLLADSPGDAILTYLLATVHASMGMHERAAFELADVLEQEPEFHVARFQLGLIYLAHGQAEETLAHWEPWLELGEDDCFFLFRRGIEHYLLDRNDLAISDLEASIERNVDYESILDDMEDILREIRSKAVAGARLPR
jgi:tetratricopeptide (TPR) repeat protein